MIQKLSQIKITDNSGAKLVQCINLKGKSASIGDIITVSVKTARSAGKVSKGQIYKALIIRTKKNMLRNDGTLLSFEDNAAVIINSTGSPIGTRIFGPVPKEIRLKGHIKLMSISPFVV